MRSLCFPLIIKHKYKNLKPIKKSGKYFLFISITFLHQVHRIRENNQLNFLKALLRAIKTRKNNEVAEMKKIVSITLAASIAAACCTFSVSAETQKDDDIVILYTNDVHCGIDNYIGYDGLALYKREMEESHKHVLLADAGDSLQGDLMGTMTEGAYITELMNSVPYDVACIGNHDFDYSVPTLMQRAEEIDCGYVCCNFKSLETNEYPFEPYKMFEPGDTQIAFVGVTTPDTFSTTRPVYLQNEDGEIIYSFGEHETELYDIVPKNVDKARNEGADYVFFLGHPGETEVFEKWSALSVAENTNGIDYLLKQGGDGYILSGKCETYMDIQALDIDVLIDLLTNTFGGKIPEEYRAPGGQGRIRFMDSTVVPVRPEVSGTDESEEESSEPDSSKPESSVTESSEPERSTPEVSQQDEENTTTNDASETKTPETGETQTTAAACVFIIILSSAVAALMLRRKRKINSD